MFNVTKTFRNTKFFGTVRQENDMKRVTPLYGLLKFEVYSAPTLSCAPLVDRLHKMTSYNFQQDKKWAQAGFNIPSSFQSKCLRKQCYVQGFKLNKLTTLQKQRCLSDGSENLGKP